MDTFSPATETLGALGDAVRLGRVEMAAHITRRAREIADESKLKLSAPPLKFLVPFYEKASLENDPGLQELWAKLLVNASGGVTRSPILIDILNKMTSEEAHLFDRICRNYGDRAPLIENVPTDGKRHFFESMLRNEILIDGSTVERIADLVEGVLALPGYWADMVTFDISDKSYEFNVVKYEVGDELRFSFLESLGLVNSELFAIKSGGAELSVSYGYITDLGLELAGCIGLLGLTADQ